MQTPTSVKKPSRTAQVEQQYAVRKPLQHKKPAGLLLSSLILNGIFVVALIGFVVLTHTRSFWFAGKVFSVYQSTCPTTVASRMETKKSDGVVTTTYFVNSAALQSGCANFLMQSAQLDNYRAHPNQAQTDADEFRKLVPDHLLNVTVVKSSENGIQLAPMQIKQ